MGGRIYKKLAIAALLIVFAWLCTRVIAGCFHDDPEGSPTAGTEQAGRGE